ncbi:GGDEF domain-containing protein [Kitasatospora aureofaciens]|uniref:GGDEF domain-containing protein n=1 Tax=Kitasatospora aureofaciens TaxID=1894 RepID=UPI001C47B69E|nr:GGDEF domain-containing protein [Kitasatospora aureofaciens]MBV6698668.1 GGDEF domain-containing protein [Kitasatospora aureofaciens]
MPTPLLVQALAALSVPALAGTAVLGLRLRRTGEQAAGREARLHERVAELEGRCAELERTASCDPLTGVWNYRHLQLTLDREIERSRRAEHTDQQDGPRPLAVLLLEIAGFDAVVAEHGRGRASAILRDLAQRLAMEIRRADTLGRYSGEEFLVVLPDTGADGAAQVAERLVWSVRRHLLLDWSSGPREPRPAQGNGLTAAVGVAVLPEDGTHAAVLLRAADRALAEARAAGGDCWRRTRPPHLPEPLTSGTENGSTAERDRSEKPGSLSPCAGGDPLTTPVVSQTPATAAGPGDGPSQSSGSCPDG